MAFPDEHKRKADPFFLGSWSNTGAQKPLRREAGFLFRIEPDLPTRVLVQSVLRPDWDYAFQNAKHLLAADPLVREFDPGPKVGETYKFRLAMLMVKRATSKGNDKGTPKEHPIRCLLPGAQPGESPRPDPKFTLWREKLAWEGNRHGFQTGEYPSKLSVAPIRNLRMKPGLDGSGGLFNAALFEGELTCIDADKLRVAIINGIGRGKAFGMGLLSLATRA